MTTLPKFADIAYDARMAAGRAGRSTFRGLRVWSTSYYGEIKVQRYRPGMGA